MAISDGFDGWLEHQLRTAAGRQIGPASAPWQARYHAAFLKGSARMSVVAKALAVVTTNGAISIVVGALAVSAAGMAGEASITGSLSPVNWGQQVVQQVQKCKEALTPGSHGIGECVSAFAQQHGQQVNSTHASGSRENPPTPKTKGKSDGNGNGNGNGNSQGQGNGNGKPKDQGNGGGGGNSQDQGNGGGGGGGNSQGQGNGGGGGNSQGPGGGGQH